MDGLQARQLLKLETIAAASDLGPQALKILDRWALGWGKKLREKEKDGSLLPELKKQTESETSVLANARAGGQNSHLAEHELMEEFGPPPGL